MNFRGVIAEDEELLRTALSSLLKEAWPQLQIVAECEDGASALESIAELQPDVAFLDIRMPGLTGIEVARGLADASPRTQVVFVTAYDQYAIDAFEQGAIDYLLKPITRERLLATVQRIQARAAAGHPDGATLLDVRAEVVAGHVLEHQIDVAVFLARLEDRHDARVAQAADCARLGEQRGVVALFGSAEMQRLDRHLALELRVPCQVDDALRAASEFASNFESPDLACHECGEGGQVCATDRYIVPKRFGQGLQRAHPLAQLQPD